MDLGGAGRASEGGRQLGGKGVGNVFPKAGGYEDTILKWEFNLYRFSNFTKIIKKKRE